MSHLREEIIKICQLAHLKKEGHLGSSLSILNILNVVFQQKKSENFDFVLSKGHASLGLYAILWRYKYIDEDTLSSFCDYGSKLGGHPDYKKISGIKFSTGSLGHGLPQSVGLCMAKKAKSDTTRTVVLCGDGEMNEGSNWEAALLAAHHNTDNLKLIVDFNRSSERAVSVVKVPDAFKALGWTVSHVDGHDEVEVQTELTKQTLTPHLIWAETVKGYGVSFMENNPEWHHKSPNVEELSQIILEVTNA